MNKINKSAPTTRNYNALQAAYDYFNGELFGNSLPACLLTLQRHKGSYGYFAGQRFGERVGKGIIDEIALNPQHFAEREPADILSTLVHEQAHVWQAHFGTPSRGGYHNKQWAEKMREVGLIPSATGKPEGKATGQNMSHYIEAGGRFERACKAWLATGGYPPFIELWTEDDGRKAAKKKKAESKTKFTCESCGLNAWAKADAFLKCGDCDEPMTCDCG